MRLKFSDPALESNSRTNVLLLFGAAALGSNSNLCSTHFPDVADEGISRLAKTWLVKFDWSLTVNFPLYDPRTQKLPVYFCGFTSIPHQPGLSIPTVPLVELAELTLIDVGRAFESGIEVF